VEVEPIPQQAQEKIEQVESADLVIGVVADLDLKSLVAVCDSLRALSGSPRIALLRDNHSANPADGRADAAANSGGVVESSASSYIVPWPLSQPDASGTPMLSIPAAYQSVFAASEKLGARACCVVASKLETASAEWIGQLAQPLLEEDADLVVPYYARHKFEGLLNSSIIAPLTRCLYGKRIHNPLGPDFGISRRLFEKMIGSERGANRAHPLASLTPTALCENLQVCEVYVGARIYPPTDWTNMSSIVSQVLSPIFSDMERNAACWQRMRASSYVPAIGDPIFVSQDAGTVDITRMVESFHLGNRDLQEIWGLVLPPSSLVELRKLGRLPLEQFQMPDDLWVRIVFDFALAHRLRTINRDHLLKSMTPLYLAWVASYARDLETGGGLALEQRLERLSAAYEAGKGYLVSRWRWPDRFNP
jgi:glucosylglycerate synthase